MLTLNQTVYFGTANVLPLSLIDTTLISLLTMTCLLAATLISTHV